MSHAPDSAVTRPETAPGPAPLPAGTSQRPGPASLTTSLVLGAVGTAPGCARATHSLTEPLPGG
jgi:hypothetical protein